MATAVILWWPILSPSPELPRISYPAQLLYVFLQVLPGSLIGGLIANTDRPLYAFYAAAPRITGLSAVQDQQLGALIMWVGGGFFFLVVFTAVFFAWAAPEIAASQGRPARPSPGPRGGSV
jgi:putative membrane protein